MPGYLIYLPGKTGSSPQHLVDAGLGGLVGSNALTFEAGDVLAHGPDGGHGLVCRFVDGKHPERAARLGVFDGQEWTHCTARGCWFGRSGPIAPEDLARPSQYDSLPAKLADGQEWRVPIAREMPHRWGLDAQGVFCRKVRSEFEGYFQRASEYFAALLGMQAEEARQFENVWSFCCQALALNYLVTPELVDWLGLIDDVSVKELLYAATEFRRVLEREDQKKSPE